MSDHLKSECQTRKDSNQCWSVRRIDLRSPLKPSGEQFARIEFAHSNRGKLTDIGRGSGAFDAMFQAVSNALSVEASLKELSLSFRAQGDGDANPSSMPECRVSLSVLRQGEMVSVERTGQHLLPTCLEAYVDALTMYDDCHCN